MAKTEGYKNRFPYAGLLLLLAVILAIPLTIWSLYYAPTNTQQQAQSFVCGPKNQNPSCPADFRCGYTSGNTLLGGKCILKTLHAPTYLKSYATCKYNQNGPNEATITFSFSKSLYATSYVINGNYYYVNQEKLVTVKVNPYYTSGNIHTITIPLPKGVKYFYWTVKAANSTFKLVSAPSISTSIALNCK